MTIIYTVALLKKQNVFRSLTYLFLLVKHIQTYMDPVLLCIILVVVIYAVGTISECCFPAVVVVSAMEDAVIGFAVIWFE